MGTAVGRAVVGIDVGTGNGTELGVAVVGAAVGSPGNTVGTGTGTTVGLGVGGAVGDGTGTLVGAAVGLVVARYRRRRNRDGRRSCKRRRVGSPGNTVGRGAGTTVGLGVGYWSRPTARASASTKNAEGRGRRARDGRSIGAEHGHRRHSTARARCSDTAPVHARPACDGHAPARRVGWWHRRGVGCPAPTLGASVGRGTGARVGDGAGASVGWLVTKLGAGVGYGTGARVGLGSGASVGCPGKTVGDELVGLCVGKSVVSTTAGTVAFANPLWPSAAAALWIAAARWPSNASRLRKVVRASGRPRAIGRVRERDLDDDDAARGLEREPAANG